MSERRFRAEEAEYNNRPVIKIYDDDHPRDDKRSLLAFGWLKARAIIACFDSIRRFHEKHERKGGDKK